MPNKPPKPKPTNKATFACFHCRKALKQAGSSAWDPNVTERLCVCAHCRQPMVRMGRYFKAPRSSARRQWLKVELLYDFGERFHAGNSGLGRSCHNLRSTVEYLTQHGHAAADVGAQLELLRRLRKTDTVPPRQRRPSGAARRKVRVDERQDAQ
jgi:hypothetical protein